MHAAMLQFQQPETPVTNTGLKFCSADLHAKVHGR
jgi:hypothetical protein